MLSPPIRARIQPFRDFLATESAGGVALVASSLVALVWANSPWRNTYEWIWSAVFELRLNSWSLTMDLRHWLNDGLMAIFFLVVGLEIKREMVEGELRDRRRRALPIIAALGGMVVPALIYVAFNYQGAWLRGWGIPMATDIALAVGIMSLAGNRVDPSLKLFLLALAIVDDVGAIIVIGLVYSGAGDRRWLLAAAVLVSAVVIVRRFSVQLISVYVVLGVGLWFLLLQAGIHATLAGVLMGWLSPTKPYVPRGLVDETELAEVGSVESVINTRRLARSTVSVVEWLERHLHPWTSFVIVPLFALANAGVALSAESIQAAFSSTVGWGIIIGLVVGKPLGILGFSALAVRTGMARLPSSAGLKDIGAAGLVAGIGFTVSVFMANAALVHPALDEAKVAILAASITAGAIGLLALNRVSRATPLDPVGNR